jgi:hypothetical protein
MTTVLALLPAAWETMRLVVNDVTRQEVTQLTALYNACSYAEPWDPTFHPIPEAELAALVNDSLSQAAAHSRFKLQTIRRKLDGEKALLKSMTCRVIAPTVPKAMPGCGLRKPSDPIDKALHRCYTKSAQEYGQI